MTNHNNCFRVQWSRKMAKWGEGTDRQGIQNQNQLVSAVAPLLLGLLTKARGAEIDQILIKGLPQSSSWKSYGKLMTTRIISTVFWTPFSLHGIDHKPPCQTTTTDQNQELANPGSSFTTVNKSLPAPNANPNNYMPLTLPYGHMAD